MSDTDWAGIEQATQEDFVMEVGPEALPDNQDRI